MGYDCPSLCHSGVCSAPKLGGHGRKVGEGYRKKEFVPTHFQFASGASGNADAAWAKYQALKHLLITLLYPFANNVLGHAAALYSIGYAEIRPIIVIYRVLDVLVWFFLFVSFFLFLFISLYAAQWYLVACRKVISSHHITRCRRVHTRRLLCPKNTL